VVLANLIAWPIAWYTVDKWLQGFAYTIDINIGIFFMAGLISFLIAFITVSFQTIKAAIVNPVGSLKAE
jgi:putative ABC transport system permease protein